jgi:hypothetical protein
MTAQNLWNEAAQLLNHAGSRPKPGRLPTRRGASIALRHKSIRPYALYRSRTAVFVGCQRPWNVGYGFNSSAAGWLTVSGRRAFRDDWTAN